MSFEIIHNGHFTLKMGRQRCKSIVLSHELTYVVKHERKGKKYTKRTTSVCLGSVCITYLSSSEAGKFFNKASAQP